MKKKIKKLLGQIKVAQLQNKKMVRIFIKKTCVTQLFNCLWNIHRIYGYTKIYYRTYLIFLKYDIKGISLMGNLQFNSKWVSYKNLLKIKSSDKNISGLLLTYIGVFDYELSMKYKFCGWGIAKF